MSLGIFLYNSVANSQTGAASSEFLNILYKSSSIIIRIFIKKRLSKSYIKLVFFLKKK